MQEEAWTTGRSGEGKLVTMWVKQSAQFIEDNNNNECF